MCIPDFGLVDLPSAPNGWTAGGPGDVLNYNDTNQNWEWLKPKEPDIPPPQPRYEAQPYTGYSAPPPPPPPAPLLPNFKSLLTSTLAIKQAPIDTIVFNNDLISNENMIELLYEDIAGLELANISREDLINGQEVIYSPIANLSSIYKLFNPNNIVSAPSTFSAYFSRFSIDLILRGMNEPYLDENTGDLIIEVDTVLDEEEIHAQITSSGTIELVEL